MAKFRVVTLALSWLLSSVVSARADLVISEFLANPSGSDSPHEYVELVATQDIDFGATPYSVVFSNNGTATSDGWVEGGRRTYAFNINSGTVTRGAVVYVGGSLANPIVSGGITLRSLDTGIVNGDSFGSSSSGGVLGNGGGSADAIAVFNVASSTITNGMAPIDAIFFGDSVGGAFLNSSDGYTLPNNDRYGGGRLQSDSFLFADGNSGQIGMFAGTFDTTSDFWTVGRTLSYTTTSTFGTTSLSLNSTAVPEPGTLVLALLGAVSAAGYLTIKRHLPFRQRAVVGVEGQPSDRLG